LATAAQRLEAWIWIWISHHTGNCFSLEVKFRSPESSLFFFLSPPPQQSGESGFISRAPGPAQTGELGSSSRGQAGPRAAAQRASFSPRPESGSVAVRSRPEFAALFRGQLENERVENFGDIAGGCCSMHPVPRGSCEDGFAGSKFSRNLPSIAWLLWFCVEKLFVDAST